MQYQIYLLVLFICILQTKGQYQGDTCVVNGVSGVCRNINTCPSVIDNAGNRVIPQLCSIDNGEAIVCCVSLSTDAASFKILEPKYSGYEGGDKDKKTCPPINPNMTAPKTGQKAWDKCVEYQEKYIFPCERSVAITGGLVRRKKCGHRVATYIVNGVDAAEAEFPHMALLGFDRNDRLDSIDDGDIIFKCGGSVISEKFILTAGHCIADHGYPVKYALLGTLRRSDKYHVNNLYQIARIIPHPNYKSPIKYHDIALLETDREIKMSKYVIPACLDVGSQPVTNPLVTGWGATGYSKSVADTLQKVTVSEYNWLECLNLIRPGRHMEQGLDPHTQICYGDPKNSNDTCGGDSGGPLQMYSKHLNCTYVVVGITSTGYHCGTAGSPGIYTKVAYYVPWIESIVWP